MHSEEAMSALCVEDVKAEIEDTFGISSIEQKLIYQGEALDDERLLRSLVCDVDAMEVDVCLGYRFLEDFPPLTLSTNLGIKVKRFVFS